MSPYRSAPAKQPAKRSLWCWLGFHAWALRLGREDATCLRCAKTAPEQSLGVLSYVDAHNRGIVIDNREWAEERERFYTELERRHAERMQRLKK